MSGRVVVVKVGPLLTGQGPAIIEQATREIEQTIGNLGASMVRSELNHVLRHQTPYYRTRVVATKGADGTKITDQGVIYGPWLEGTGSRNKTTRFKGYATFRRTTQLIRRRAQDIAQSVITRYIGKLQ